MSVEASIVLQSFFFAGVRPARRMHFWHRDKWKTDTSFQSKTKWDVGICSDNSGQIQSYLIQEYRYQTAFPNHVFKGTMFIKMAQCTGSIIKMFYMIQFTRSLINAVYKIIMDPLVIRIPRRLLNIRLHRVPNKTLIQTRKVSIPLSIERKRFIRSWQ